MLSVSIASQSPIEVGTSLLVIALPENPTLAGIAALDAATQGALTRMIDMKDFRGARDETLHLTGFTKGPRRILLVGMGAITERRASLKRAATLAARNAHRLGVGEMVWYSGEISPEEVEVITIGLIAGAWEYADLKSPVPEPDRKKPLERAIILTNNTDETRRGLNSGKAIGDGQSLARRLAMMPGNLCTPDVLADTARDIGKRYGMDVTVLGRKDLEKEKMGSFLAVAQGTPQDPKLIAIEFNGGKPNAKPVVLVGKGLCFDSGGISIKPAQGMEFMKFDMCGAAGVLGTMEAIGQLKPEVNVVGIIGATTNMPSGTAMNPGDVVKASNGKSIEIINTDAEGRLVLADCLHYATRFNPDVVIDAATLTGACVIALGHTASAVFSTDEPLVSEILAAGKRAGEPGWPLPLWDEYKDLIKSDVADVKNSGGRPAGAVTAALFLKEFAEGYPWAHLDIAGTAYSETDLVTIPKGPTGVPTGTFIEFVRGRAR
ncbi:MAG TPA: leucyl aminopeptidase [Gemmatimonadaceae bacterium]|nr:leucyl aminopeptidase [Gemmatimonadaceae bacterium]